MPETPESQYGDFVSRMTDIASEVSITWCESATAETLASSLGADPSSVGPRTLSAANEESYEHIMEGYGGRTLLIAGAGRWFTVVEPGDTHASRAVHRLSRSGEAVSVVFGDTLSHYSLLYARQGRLLCRLRWLDDPAGDVGHLGHLLDDLLLTADPSATTWKIHALTLAERITGVRLDTAWLAREHPRYIRAG
ncbi:hypothetical protein ACFQ08_02255 [Streptosporangium algeriense]|uniref:SUKH-4 immunity protein of toxin-antitoxin system n=1 Tax=Streptosporangium algeriense TaxID=1682748 RepID=A0ABW3DHK2_9ACTN